jgi:hypothetical protein
LRGSGIRSWGDGEWGPEGEAMCKNTWYLLSPRSLAIVLSLLSEVKILSVVYVASVTPESKRGWVARYLALDSLGVSTRVA